MGALQLSEIQTNIRLDGWPLGAPNVPSAFNDVCRQAVARLTTLQASIQARHDVEDLLIKQLNLGTPNEEALREIATQYNLAPMPTGSKKDLAAAHLRSAADCPISRGRWPVARRPGRSRRQRARGGARMAGPALHVDEAEVILVVEPAGPRTARSHAALRAAGYTLAFTLRHRYRGWLHLRAAGFLRRRVSS